MYLIEAHVLVNAIEGGCLITTVSLCACVYVSLSVCSCVCTAARAQMAKYLANKKWVCEVELLKKSSRCSITILKHCRADFREFLHENTGFTLTLLENDPQNSNSEESSENRETFSGRKFSPATGVNLLTD